MKKKVLKTIIGYLLKIDNLIYRLISKYSVKLENGIHPKHRLTKYHVFFINNVGSDENVLDIGCGNGYNTYKIAEKARSVVGIDINEDNIRLARDNFQRENIEYIIGDATSYLFNKKFDVVILSNVLEHIEDRIQLLKEIKSLGGKILIRVPLLDRSWVVLYKKESGVEYKLDNTHCIEYTLTSFLDELVAADLEAVKYSIQFGEIWSIVKNKIKSQ